ncbi:MAG: activator of Hsp90 ATPase 1 family protein [Bacteroidetes bacterium]|nr:activator of Hsp90 ATPase 1 family protein [Bacteroidota bacterium]
MANKTKVEKDLKKKSVLVSREFKAPLSKVWRAYTESKFLDQWWGPSPWRAETKTIDFKSGGYWLYAMVGPENEKHWGRMNYIAIDLHKSFAIEDAFCDENGNQNAGLPVSKGQIVFTEKSSGALVEFKMIYNTEEDIKKIIEMGFEQGITICMDQLEKLLEENKI